MDPHPSVISSLESMVAKTQRRIASVNRQTSTYSPPPRARFPPRKYDPANDTKPKEKRRKKKSNTKKSKSLKSTAPIEQSKAFRFNATLYCTICHISCSIF